MSCEAVATDEKPSFSPTPSNISVTSGSASVHKTQQRTNAIWNGDRLYFRRQSKSGQMPWKRVLHSIAFLLRLRSERQKSFKRAASRKRWTVTGTAVRFKIRLWNSSKVGKKGKKRRGFANYKVSSKETAEFSEKGKMAPSLKRKSLAGGTEAHDSTKKAALALKPVKSSTYAAFLVNTHGNFVKVNNDLSVTKDLNNIISTVNQSPTGQENFSQSFKTRLKQLCTMDPTKAAVIITLAVVITAIVVCVRIFKLFK